jgi:hypothetical protein
VFNGYKDLDHGELASLEIASQGVLDAINACKDIDELNEYIDEKLLCLTAVEEHNKHNTAETLKAVKGFGTLAIGSPVCSFTYTDPSGSGEELEISVTISKLIDKTYSTAETEEQKADTNGESPYAIYYQWMLTNSFYPGVLTEE